MRSSSVAGSLAWHPPKFRRRISRPSAVNRIAFEFYANQFRLTGPAADQATDTKRTSRAVLMIGASDDQRPDSVPLGVEERIPRLVAGIRLANGCYLPTIHGAARNSTGYETLSEAKALRVVSSQLNPAIT
jgi:hypothetical protein